MKTPPDAAASRTPPAAPVAPPSKRAAAPATQAAAPQAKRVHFDVTTPPRPNPPPAGHTAGIPAPKPTGLSAKVQAAGRHSPQPSGPGTKAAFADLAVTLATAAGGAATAARLVPSPFGARTIGADLPDTDYAVAGYTCAFPIRTIEDFAQLVQGKFGPPPTAFVGYHASGVLRDAIATQHGNVSISCDLLPCPRRGLHAVGRVTDYLHLAKWEIGCFSPNCHPMRKSDTVSIVDKANDGRF